MQPNIQVGTVEGTGAAINIELGFEPDWIEVQNIDGNAAGKWSSNMPAASMVKRTAGTFSKPTTNGISPYAGVRGTAAKGFTIGADADLNVDGETLVYVAMRSGAGAQ